MHYHQYWNRSNSNTRFLLNLLLFNSHMFRFLFIVLAIFIFPLYSNGQKITFITDFIFDGIDRNPCYQDNNGFKYFAKKNGKYGIIDAKGKTIVDFIYDEIKPFSNGKAAVKSGDYWGFIDNKGTIIIPIEYMFPYGDFLFSYQMPSIATMGKYCKIGAIDTSNNVVIDFIYGGLIYCRYNYFKVIYKNEKKWGIIDTRGKQIIPMAYDDIDADSLNLFKVEVNAKFGWIDTLQHIVIPAIYENAELFSQGLAAVKLNGKWGYINKKGKFVIQPLYDRATSFDHDKAQVKLGEKYYSINKIGTISEYIWKVSRFPSSNGFQVAQKGELFGYLDKDDKVVIPFKFKYADSFQNGFAAVKDMNNKEYHIGSQGMPLYNQRFTSIENFSEGLAIAKNGNKYGYINIRGNMVIPDTFDYVFPFASGLAAFKLNEKWGFIDYYGNVVFKPQFSNISCSVGSHYTAKTDNGEYLLISRDMMKKDRETYQYLILSDKGLSMVQKNNKWAIVVFTKPSHLMGRHTEIENITRPFVMTSELPIAGVRCAMN